MLNNRSKLFVVLGMAQIGVIVEGTFCCASFVKHARLLGAGRNLC